MSYGWELCLLELWPNNILEQFGKSLLICWSLTRDIGANGILPFSKWFYIFQQILDLEHFNPKKSLSYWSARLSSNKDKYDDDDDDDGERWRPATCQSGRKLGLCTHPAHQTSSNKHRHHRHHHQYYFHYLDCEYLNVHWRNINIWIPKLSNNLSTWCYCYGWVLSFLPLM